MPYAAVQTQFRKMSAQPVRFIPQVGMLVQSKKFEAGTGFTYDHQGKSSLRFYSGKKVPLNKNWGFSVFTHLTMDYNKLSQRQLIERFFGEEVNVSSQKRQWDKSLISTAEIAFKNFQIGGGVQIENEQFFGNDFYLSIKPIVQANYTLKSINIGISNKGVLLNCSF